MSKESMRDLNQNTLIGFTDKRGFAWHYRASEQGAEANHYPGAVPVDDVIRRLFHWEPEVAPAGFMVGGTFVADPARKYIIRPDTLAPLGVFKEGYTPHSYRPWLLDTVASILDDDLQVGSAGLLRAGAVAWVSVEVPDTITTPEGFDYRPHLLAATSCDGSLATTYKRIVTAVVCDNTLTAGLGEAGQVFRAKHTRNSGMKLASARDALGIIHSMADDFAAEVARLCAVTVTRADFARFLDAFVPVDTDGGSKRSATMADNKRGEITKLYTTDLRVAPWNGTAFGVLQAVNTYNHHVGIVRGMTRPERNMLNAVDGTTATNDAVVLDTLAAVLS